MRKKFPALATLSGNAVELPTNAAELFQAIAEGKWEAIKRNVRGSNPDNRLHGFQLTDAMPEVDWMSPEGLTALSLICHDTGNANVSKTDSFLHRLQHKYGETVRVDIDGQMQSIPLLEHLHTILPTRLSEISQKINNLRSNPQVATEGLRQLEREYGSIKDYLMPELSKKFEATRPITHQPASTPPAVSDAAVIKQSTPSPTAAPVSAPAPEPTAPQIQGPHDGRICVVDLDKMTLKWRSGTGAITQTLPVATPQQLREALSTINLTIEEFAERVSAPVKNTEKGGYKLIRGPEAFQLLQQAQTSPLAPRFSLDLDKAQLIDHANGKTERTIHTRLELSQALKELRISPQDFWANVTLSQTVEGKTTESTGNPAFTQAQSYFNHHETLQQAAAALLDIDREKGTLSFATNQSWIETNGSCLSAENAREALKTLGVVVSDVIKLHSNVDANGQNAVTFTVTDPNAMEQLISKAHNLGYLDQNLSNLALREWQNQQQQSASLAG